MGQEEFDVASLVDQLRHEADDLRQKIEGQAGQPLGQSGPTPAQRRRALEARLENLRAMAEGPDKPLHSHRASWVGRPILAIKRVLIRLLTPVWEQRMAFDREVVDLLQTFQAEMDAGTPRTGERLARLEQRLCAIEDSLEQASAPTSTIPPDFPYDSFESEFRGDPETVRRAQANYLQYFPDPASGPVLDLGCGEGLFLSLLTQRGIQACGVDHGENSVAKAQAAGLDVSRGDLLATLESYPDHSLGGVVCFQVLEHLSLAATLQLLRVTKRKLRPGGVFLAETLNLASLIVFSRSWTIDPTHRQALHPLTLRFLVDDAGFRESEILYSGDVEEDKRLEVSDTEGPEARNAARLNSTVFAPQDYAIVARA